VRTGKRSAASSDKELWLLIKHRDEYADPSWDIKNPRLNRSVLTGRSIKEIESGSPKNAPRGARDASATEARALIRTDEFGPPKSPPVGVNSSP
jgi:hypothetical protein